MEFFTQIDGYLTDFLTSAGIWAPILSCILIFLEAIFAFLPLFAFITVVFESFGQYFGPIAPALATVVCWFFTVLGSFFVFYFCRKKILGFINKKVNKSSKLNEFMKVVSNLKFSQILLIISIPFTPSFFVNLGAGLSNIPTKKYLYALMIGKFFTVIFWGTLGCSLLDCLTQPMKLIPTCILVIVPYIFGKIINKKFGLDERM